MKKLAIFLAIMLIPFSAFALDTISDSELNDVTGQAGVSIYTNSINIVKTGVTTTYTDVGDGTAADPGGSITVLATNSNKSIFFGGINPILIDVVDMSTLASAAAFGNNHTLNAAHWSDTGVMIHLPDSIIIVDHVGSEKQYYTGGTANVGDSTNNLINITKNGGTTTISKALSTMGGAGTSDHQIGIIITAHD